MKRVVEYKLHGNEIPYFIENGGHFPNGGKLIGLTKDDANCYIPSDSQLVTFATKADLANHIKTLSIIGRDNNALSSDQKAALANAWWDANV